MFLLNLLVAASGTVAGYQERPNIIVFLVDDMGLMDTSVPFLTDGSGNRVRHSLNNWYHTPNMERMAEQGICFSTFYAQSVSSPSRASLLTGQNATRHRTTNWINAESNNRTPFGPPDWNWKGLTKDIPTMPKFLQQAGYKTIHIGKAHFGCMDSEGENPLNLGFDVNIAGSGIGHPGSYYGEWGYGHIKGSKARAVPDLEKYHGTDTFLSEALTIEANREIAKAVEEKRPFYLNMAHYAVHAPFQADKRFLSRYTDPNKKEQAKAFATLIEGMDKSLGDIMDQLEKLGIAENTLIFFLGDNGGDAPLGEERGYGSSAPLRGKKGTEFEGGMRVPFIADYVIDGFDLKKQLSGKVNRKRLETFLMHFPHAHRGNYFTVYREGDWKLIYYYSPETPKQPKAVLYNLKEDQEEKKELSSVFPDKCREMIRNMSSRLEKEGALYPIDKQGNELKPFVYF